ncbi:helix-turn-helix domain-containing protein [Streptomyces pimonensis]|uniref:Helix-turn-helix domain-containing protein n=1 Tax=Streptomyces pimonensis TaxID=2860288 RepID=A0ABV4J7Q5_9ACTN
MAHSPEDRQEAAKLLARGASCATVGRRLGIPERTIRNWRKQSTFMAVIEEARAEVLADTVASLTHLGPVAVHTLARALAGDTEVTAQQRRAAVDTLKLIPGFRTHAVLEAKLAELEAMTTWEKT